MIKSFKCKKTEKLYRTGKSPKFKSIERVALRKLDMLAAAISLSDLKVPPNNRLEALTGNRKGQYSIRIDQFRICFEWGDGAGNVEIVD